MLITYTEKLLIYFHFPNTTKYNEWPQALNNLILGDDLIILFEFGHQVFANLDVQAETGARQTKTQVILHLLKNFQPCAKVN